MFSERTSWDLSPNRLAVAVAARRAAGLPVVDLTSSNPTRVGLPAPAGVLELLSAPGGLQYDPDPCGMRSAREAVAGDYARRGFAVDPEQLVLTASTSEAYAYVFKVLADPGDNVLVPQPSYPLFEFLARAEGLSVRTYPLEYDGEWHLHESGLRAAMDARTRAIVVVNPNNPTGSYLKSGERLALRRVAAEHGVALVSDEVFADFALCPDPRREPSLADEQDVLAFSLGGLSKTGGLPQMKLGWIAVAGPAHLRDAALRRLDVVADTYLSVSTPVQLAAPGILARVPGLQAPILARVRHNHHRLTTHLAGTGASLLTLEGGWSAVIRVPATVGEEDWVMKLLQEDGVLVHPGYFFDFPRGAHLVVSLLPEPGAFDAGVVALARQAAAAS